MTLENDHSKLLKLQCILKPFITSLTYGQSSIWIHIYMLIFVPENICSTLNKSRWVTKKDFRIIKFHFKQLPKKNTMHTKMSFQPQKRKTLETSKVLRLNCKMRTGTSLATQLIILSYVLEISVSTKRIWSNNKADLFIWNLIFIF